MHLREGERILKIYRHHATPFIYQVFIAILGTFPFFMLLFLLKEGFDTKGFVIANLIIFIIFLLVATYMSLIYWLDKFIVTDLRIIFVDWRSLTSRHEYEAFFNEIQEIQTKERGMFSYFKLLDYGTISIQTASAHVDIEFPDAPDPEGIRRFIYQVRSPKNDSK